MKMHHSFVKRFQVGLGVLVAITLLGLIAILTSGQRVGAALDRSTQALSLLDDFKEVQIKVLTARAAEREFLIDDLRSPSFFQSGDSPALERHRTTLAELDQLLGGLERREGGSDATAATIRAAVEAYGESFSELVALYRERGFIYSGLVEEMRRATFGFLESIEVLPEIAQVGLRTELFELTGDQAEYLRDLASSPRFLVTERLKVLHEEIDLLDSESKQTIHAQVDLYQKTWTRLLEIDDRIGDSPGVGLRGSLREVQETVAPLTLAALDYARANFKQANHTAHEAQAMARLVSAGAVLLAVAIALFLAVTLSAQVRGSLATILRAVEAYSRGERSARVGALPRRDEFSVLGESFDHLAETLAETAAELEEVNASLELAIKGDTVALVETIKGLVAEREPTSR